MNRRPLAAAGALVLTLSACSGGVSPDDLAADEQTTYAMFADLDTELSSGELACVVRALSDADVDLPSDTVAELDADQFDDTEVASCSDAAGPIASLVDAVSEVRDQHVAELADQIEAQARVAVDAPATVGSPSENFQAALEGTDLDGYLDALALPEVVRPDDTMLVHEAVATVQLDQSTATEREVTLAWLMEESLGATDGYVEQLEDDGFSHDEDAQIDSSSLDEDVSYVGEMYVRDLEQLTVWTARGEALGDTLYVTATYESGPLAGDDSDAAEAPAIEQAALTAASAADVDDADTNLLPESVDDDQTLQIADEHAWVDQLQVPESTQIQTIRSGIRPTRTSIETDLELVRSIRFRLPIPDAEPFRVVVERGNLFADTELAVDESAGNLDSTMRFELAGDGVVGNLDVRREDAEFWVALDVAAAIDIELGAALDLSPDVDDGWIPEDN